MSKTERNIGATLSFILLIELLSSCVAEVDKYDDLNRQCENPNTTVLQNRVPVAQQELALAEGDKIQVGPNLLTVKDGRTNYTTVFNESEQPIQIDDSTKLLIIWVNSGIWQHRRHLIEASDMKRKNGSVIETLRMNCQDRQLPPPPLRDKQGFSPTIKGVEKVTRAYPGFGIRKN